MKDRIALVDDDQNILTSVTLTLESEGFDVDCYNDGETALMGLARRPANVGVFDIKMPRMDGMELLQKVRANSQMPVIFLTSKDDELDEGRDVLVLKLRGKEVKSLKVSELKEELQSRLDDSIIQDLSKPKWP